MDTYIILKNGTGEVVEKKSRFIANLVSVSSEEEAESYIASVRKQYYDARHNCYAYIIGNNMEKKKCSDDGEPSGTAGRPMLEVLEKNGLTNALIVVTRYFGGTLLGTGGLLRAYQGASIEAVKDAAIAMKCAGRAFIINCPYTMLGKFERYAESGIIHFLNREYGENISLKLLCNDGDYDKVTADITEMSEGKLAPGGVENVSYAQSEGKIILL
ncbi:MAG: YigZ family protein [Lachnospiraceae bacterium]|nr:YigZ family protein [Lachnospiraceae bacterium]MBO4461332.1 YigZ family protein [Lachnospiraceae bacterium]MBR4795859.1 YigZ family protein [Lachnospiraceae bacterium]